MKVVKRQGLFAATVAVAASLAMSVAAYAAVTIVVNGQTVSFDQPPIEKSGRVFVPLRGVFERLGASVVYDNGIINATGNGRTISLHIGSNTATVNGAQETLDVAPFLVGARTLVPLRFVSQALGATVDYNDNTQTVTISMAGATPVATAASISIQNEKPAPGSVVSANRPAVSGSFSAAVDPNSVKVTLDGRDVSSTTYVSANNFLFSPSYNLAATQHTVNVSGKSSDDSVSFSRSWSFTSGTSAVQNYITNLSPANGASVNGNGFTVSGTTLPNSRVHITALGSADLGGMFRVTTGSYSADLTADASGNFSQQVSLNSVQGGLIGVRITSVAPTTNAASTVTVSYKS